MKIRSITFFANPGWPLDVTLLRHMADFAAVARPAFEAARFEVQTLRLATPPFAHPLPDCKTATVVEFAQALETVLLPMGFDYVSLGPAQVEAPESYAAIPAVIASTQNVFASGVIAARGTGIALPAVRACAEIIQQLATQDKNGFANLYFAALANVPPGSPFFPAAYHDEGQPAFAIATEAADLAVEAFSQADSLFQARENLIRALESHAQKLVAVAKALTTRFSESLNLRFGGIDYSLAPFPKTERSLGTALEHLGVPALGLHGSLAAAAFLADAVDRADFPRTGFSGLMLPVLEDATLAARAAQGSLTIKDLLLYSAVCGTGLDTVPLPGAVTTEQLSAILLDLATLALRLDKPLTARLMPIPGKESGDLTDFDFAFFANSRVLRLETQPLTGFFGGDEHFSVFPRKACSSPDGRSTSPPENSPG